MGKMHLVVTPYVLPVTTYVSYETYGLKASSYDP